MFLDEPTSGLSSRDSENILDLLKELARKGKLLFIVIHQPSSEIFKMFDSSSFLIPADTLYIMVTPLTQLNTSKGKLNRQITMKANVMFAVM